MANMPDQQTIFDTRADKWFESRWVLVAAVTTILIPVFLVYVALRLSDNSQTDENKYQSSRIDNLSKEWEVFQNGDFKDLQRQVSEMNANVIKLETIIEERIPAKK